MDISADCMTIMMRQPHYINTEVTSRRARLMSQHSHMDPHTTVGNSHVLFIIDPHICNGGKI